MAGFEYDRNGNRKKLSYYLDGSLNGDTAAISYTYNNDNLLTGFNTSAAPTFKLENANIDGLGRLKSAAETLTKTDNSTIAHSLSFDYDSLSQMVSAGITNAGSPNWQGEYVYHKNGDMTNRTIESNETSFTYFGNEMTHIGNDELVWNENGQLSQMPTMSLEYNWEGKLRKVYDSNNNLLVSFKYDPAGNRISKNSAVNGNKKFIVDVSSDVPKVILELDAANNAILKSYVHTDREVLMQEESGSSHRYYYLHDRLGSVRQIIDETGSVVNYYTYDPWGRDIEMQETTSNPYRFAGYFWDDEPKMYYCIARYYHPELMRFASCDSAMGKFEQPLSLHKYLYCENDPINGIDPAGLWKTAIHNELIEKIFGDRSLEAEDIGYLEKGSELIDTLYQGEKESYMHAMRYEGQGKKNAEKQMWKFINQKIEKANFLLWIGLDEEAYMDLGMALHPIIDSTSPAHKGFQIWYGVSDTEHLKIHREKEKEFKPEMRQEAVKTMDDFLNKYWKN